MTAATHTNDTAPATPWERHKWPVLAAVIAIQLLLVLLVVLPQLSPRVSGTEIQLRVAPYDPIDPFRGAYVDLTYPDLPTPSDYVHGDSDQLGTAYVPLRQEGDVWVAVGPIQRTAPDGLFLACDDRSWRLKCGVELVHLPVRGRGDRAGDDGRRRDRHCPGRPVGQRHDHRTRADRWLRRIVGCYARR